MTRSTGLMIAGLATLLACAGEDTVGGPFVPATFELSDTAAWSGGTVAVSSASFKDLTYLPIILAGAETLTVARKDAETFEVSLPRGPAGEVELVLHDAGREQPLGTIRLAGFRSVATYSPGFDFSMLIAARRAGEPVVLGNGASGGITVFSPSLGTAVRVTGLRAPFSYYGIGQVYSGDRFVLRDSTGVLGIWSLWPVPAKLEPWVGPTIQRQVAQLAPSVFMATSSHWTESIDTTPPGRQYCCFDTESSWGVFLSPRGDRAVVRSTSSRPLVPVLDMHTGDTAYSLPNTVSAAGIAFSTNGADLYVAGYRFGPTDSLKRYDAATGQRLAAVALPDSSGIRNLEADSAGRWVYLHVHTDCRPRVLIYDATTLAKVGDAPVPDTVTGLPCDNTTWEGMLVVDDVRGRLWVVWNGDPFPVFEFSVPR